MFQISFILGEKSPNSLHIWTFIPYTHPHSWLDPLFWLGLRRSLEQTDLYAHPSEADSEKLLKKFNK